MKKLIIILKNFFLLTMMLLIIGFIFQSCEKHEITVIEKQNGRFTVKDGMLVFKSTQDFMIIKDSVSKLSDYEMEKFEKSIGFKTQKTILKEIIKAEIDIDLVNQGKYTYDQAKSMDPDLLHSDTYNKFLKAGLIKIVDENTDNEYWKMPMGQKAVMEIIGEKGSYAIGNSLIYVNGTEIKDKEISKDTQSPGLIPSGWRYGGTTNKRTAIQVYLETDSYLVPSHRFDIYHDIYVQNQNKNWLGSWKYAAAETWISAYWSMYAFYNVDWYDSSWSYHNMNVADFKASVDPRNGNNPGFQYLFLLYPDDPAGGSDDLTDSYYQIVYWLWGYNNNQYSQYQVTRIGGDSGISATVPIITGEQ